MTVELRRARRSQPQGPFRLDPSSPLTRGITVAWAGSSALATTLRGFQPTLTNTSIVASQVGLAASITTGAGAGVKLAANPETIFAGSTATIMVLRRSRDTTARSSTLFGYDNGAGDRVLCHGPFSDGNLYFDFGSATAGRVSAAYAKSTDWELLVFVAGSRGREVWRNGVLLVGNTGVTGARTANTTSQFQIGANNALDPSDNDDVALFVVSTDEWSVADIKRLSAMPTVSPWQLFASRRVFLPDEGASAAGSHPATGALTAGSATIAGTASHLLLHTSTGALAAQAATIAGTAVHPHTSTGALAAQAATVASSAALTVPGGTHAGTGTLTATAALVTGTAAHLTLHAATGALAADAAVVTGAGAHLTTHAASGDLVASPAVVAGAAFIGDAPAATGASGASNRRRRRLYLGPEQKPAPVVAAPPPEPPPVKASAPVVAAPAAPAAPHVPRIPAALPQKPTPSVAEPELAPAALADAREAERALLQTAQAEARDQQRLRRVAASNRAAIEAATLLLLG